ncbi:MAG: HD domain-containing protein [Candidatus Marinimicrobia bacterium]|jgi:putative nucleotidyltransferase with HDIG domain|nr:HD domain-containing protein [Candidatus Neomarinimicrobiota bacterium]
MANLKDLIEKNSEAAEILKLAGSLGEKSGMDTYAVGGYVRDLFLERPVKEIDLMVVGDGIALAKLLAKELGVKKVVPFEKFGTAHIPSKPFPIEVTGGRTEAYEKESRNPQKIESADINTDLMRRDFTVNAMAVNLMPDAFGELIDPFQGISDLHAKHLKTPLSANETFSDDPLRMMRAAYFASELDFELDEKCLKAMVKNAERITIVSQERITNEFTKILASQKPSIGLRILQEVGLLNYVFPEIEEMVGLEQTSKWHHKDIYNHTLQVVDNAAALSNQPNLRFAGLVHDIAKPRTRRLDKNKGYTFHGHDEIGARMLGKIAKRMKLSNELRDYLQKLTRLHLRPIALAQENVTDSAVRRLMVAAGDEIDDLMKLCRADITSQNPALVKKYMSNFERVENRMQDVQERDAMKAFQSPVRGDEIMKICGLKEGKAVGKLKSEIESAILNGDIENTHEAAMELLLKKKDDILS